jgi:hypothetical protein
MPAIASLFPKWRRALLLIACLWGMALDGFAGSNVNLQHAYAWGGNVGWLRWRDDATNGVELAEFICSGSVYSSSLGWISLGNGRPANGIQYRNDSASDYGVNVIAPSGQLRGFAYAANAGWVRFEEKGAPRVDMSSGRLSGYVYGANIGWINLGDSGFWVGVDSIAAGADSDGDGIPDAWEWLHAGNLSTFNATSDSDQDGQSDIQEYRADTDPLDAEDCLKIVEWSPSPNGSGSTLAWASTATRQYTIEIRPQFGSETPWTAVGAGPLWGDGKITRRVVPVAGNQQFLRIRASRPLSP